MNILKYKTFNENQSTYAAIFIPDKKLSILGTITGGKLRKRSGLLGIFAQTSKSLAGIGGDGGLDDFAELPPNQRRKKLQSKIDALTSKICQETAARDG